VRIPILTKITIPYLILALAIAVGASFLVSQVILDSVEERFTNQLIETGFQSTEILARQEKDLLEDLRTLSFTAGLSETVAQDDLGELENLVIPVAYNSSIGAFAILDANGSELVSGSIQADQLIYEPLPQLLAWLNWDFVRNVVDEEVDASGDKYIGLAEIEGITHLFVAGPIPDERGNMVGIAIAGKPLQEIIDVLERETLADFSFYFLNGDETLSTFEREMQLADGLLELLIQTSDQGSSTRPISEGVVDYTELLIPAEVREDDLIGYLGVALPNSFITRTSSINRGNTFALIGVVLVVVSVVGVFVARIITRPIQELKEAAERVSQGDLSIQVESGGQDEIGVLADSFNEMVSNVSQSKQDLITAYDRTIEGWAKALDLRDHETEGHSRRVTEMTMKLANRLGMPQQELENMQRGALLHDIGKIGIPDSILLKKGGLSDEEFDVMRQHPHFGRDFMDQIDFLAPAMAIPYSHHEKWDGSGYPQGLKGDEIPKAARIFSVVDVWDAITSDRPYRKAMSYEEAVSIIKEGNGSHFDPEICNAFLRMIAEDHADPNHDFRVGKASLYDLGLSTQVVKTLISNGVTNTIELLALLEEGENKLLNIDGIGKKTVENILQSLE